MIRRRFASDEGMTLIELVVASLLGLLILTIAGGFIINGLRGQHSVSNLTDATNSGQLTATAIQTDIRNASAVKVVPGTNQFVTARVARGGNTTVVWKCVAWYYSATAKEIRFKTSTSAISSPSTTEFKNWTVIATGINPVGGKVFDGDIKHLDMTFSVDAGTADPVVISSSAYSRNPSGEHSQCF